MALVWQALQAFVAPRPNSPAVLYVWYDDNAHTLGIGDIRLIHMTVTQ